MVAIYRLYVVLSLYATAAGWQRGCGGTAYNAVRTQWRGSLVGSRARFSARQRATRAHACTRTKASTFACTQAEGTLGNQGWELADVRAKPLLVLLLVGIVLIRSCRECTAAPADLSPSVVCRMLHAVRRVLSPTSPTQGRARGSQHSAAPFTGLAAIRARVELNSASAFSAQLRVPKKSIELALARDGRAVQQPGRGAHGNGLGIGLRSTCALLQLRAGQASLSIWNSGVSCERGGHGRRRNGWTEALSASASLRSSGVASVRGHGPCGEAPSDESPSVTTGTPQVPCGSRPTASGWASTP